MSEDSLGDRMKRYEEASKQTLPPRMPAIIRVDGRAFHTYTRGLPAFDHRLKTAMDRVALALCKEIGNCKLAYVQSDEISLVMCDYHSHDSQPYFGGVIQKIVSVTAAMAAVTMTVESVNLFGGYTKPGATHLFDMYSLPSDGDRQYQPCPPKPCTFDSRVFVLPEEDVQNYFIWRQQDWTSNSVQMMARREFSQKQCQNKDNNELKDMLLNEKGQNWNHIPTWAKRGRVVRKMPVTKLITGGPRAGQMMDVSDWTVDNEIPIFSQDRSYLERLFVRSAFTPTSFHEIREKLIKQAELIT